MAEHWLSFAQDHWWLILAAVVALFLIVSVMKTILKWALVAVVIGVVVLYGMNYQEELVAMGDTVLAEAKEQAFEAIARQALDAEYEAHADGTYAVFTESVRVEGREGSNEVTVYWKGVKIGTFQADAAIQAFLEQAKENQ